MDLTTVSIVAILQVTAGPIVGVLVGYVGAKTVTVAYRKRWMREQAEGIVALAIAFLTFSLAGLFYGNGFLAAFVAGLTFGNVLAQQCRFLYEFTEAEGLFLVLMTFFIFGGAMLPEALVTIRPSYLLFAILSLTLLRMLPVRLSPIGTGLRPVTNGFLGWFGPRGLASVLFVLLIVEGGEFAGRETIFSAAMVTVMLSIILHGITAGPATRWYARQVARMGECEEAKPVSEAPFTETTP